MHHVLVTSLFVAWSISAGVANAADTGKDFVGLRGDIKSLTTLLDKCPGPLIKSVPCFKVQSDQGNGSASEMLAKLYADPNYGEEPSGITANKAESIRYTLKAIKQGHFGALEFIPPQPYKWQIGMSGAQVKNSVDGSPERVISSESESGYGEVWSYPNAALYFARAPQSGTKVVLKQINIVSSK